MIGHLENVGKLEPEAGNDGAAVDDLVGPIAAGLGGAGENLEQVVIRVHDPDLGHACREILVLFSNARKN